MLQFPQDAKDAVVAASALVMQVQTIISRSINPIESGVITLGKFEQARSGMSLPIMRAMKERYAA